MFHDFSQANAPVATVLRRDALYEFPWGFVAESGQVGSWMIWSLYVQTVWRECTSGAWARFDLAHQRLVEQAMLAARDQRDSTRGLHLTFVSGEVGQCAASYGCLSPLSSVAAREWMGTVLLPDLWPQTLELANATPGAKGVKSKRVETQDTANKTKR